jgi:hypothetical protein
MLSPARSSDDDKRSDYGEPSIETSDEQGGDGMGGDKLGVTGKISPARSSDDDKRSDYSKPSIETIWERDRRRGRDVTNWE